MYNKLLLFEKFAGAAILREQDKIEKQEPDASEKKRKRNDLLCRVPILFYKPLVKRPAQAERGQYKDEIGAKDEGHYGCFSNVKEFLPGPRPACIFNSFVHIPFYETNFTRAAHRNAFHLLLSIGIFCY